MTQTFGLGIFDAVDDLALLAGASTIPPPASEARSGRSSRQGSALPPPSAPAWPWS